MSTGPLLALELDARRPLGVQIEEQLRGLIRSEGLGVGRELPSTRALAADLGVSRGVVVGAYAQLAAEGYIGLRRGAAPVVTVVPQESAERRAAGFDVPVARARFNLRPDLPDFALFPRAQWLAATRASLQRAANADLSYGEPFGAVVLRNRLAPFLARTRGVLATPERTGVFAGSTHALSALASVLRDSGARCIAVEDPGHRWRIRVLRASGLDLAGVPVDEQGLRVDRIPGDAAAVVVSPDHNFPLGATLSAERRRALLDWAVQGERLVIEHDFDGHFRYDRPPAGTLQALAPEHVAYLGTVSPLLAPTLRIGWAVVPLRLVDPLALHLFANVVATPRLAQLALAEFIERGYLDRHLRRARAAYKRRRELAIDVLRRRVPAAVLGGAPVGLYLPVALPLGVDEGAVLAAARGRGIAVDGVNEHSMAAHAPGLVVGFAALPEATLRRALGILAEACREAFAEPRTLGVEAGTVPARRGG
jgi:GntR family transcriptional regulator/MocR family aminotransferase